MEKLFIGTDHGGFEFKRRLVELLRAKGYDITDVGPHTYDKGDDYPDYAEKVCNSIAASGGKGILICRSGHGMAITANKFPGIYASVCCSTESARLGKKDDDINVLCLSGDLVTVEEAEKIVVTWLETPFESIERRNRRLDKVKGIEKRNFKPF